MANEGSKDDNRVHKASFSGGKAIGLTTLAFSKDDDKRAKLDYMIRKANKMLGSDGGGGNGMSELAQRVSTLEEKFNHIPTTLKVWGMIAGTGAFYGAILLFIFDMHNTSINQRFNDQNESIGLRFEQVDSRFKQVDAKFDQVDKRFDRVDKRFDKVEAALVKLAESQEKISNDVAYIRARLDK